MQLKWNEHVHTDETTIENNSKECAINMRLLSLLFADAGEFDK